LEDPSFPSLPGIEPDLSAYSRLPDILRSWFWRYYDHLFQMIFLNLGWFLCSFGSSWILGRLGLWNEPAPWYWLGLFAIFLVESWLTYLWAIPVFAVIMGGPISWQSYREKLNCSWGRGFLSSTLVGLFLGFGFLSLRFYFSIQGSSPIWVFVLIGFVVTILVYGVMMVLYLWPLLLFQNPSLGKLFYRSFMVTLGSGPISLFMLLFSLLWLLVFTAVPFFWFILGFTLLFSLYCAALEKHLLRYKITFQDRPWPEVIADIDSERKRGWRDILKPWENR